MEESTEAIALAAARSGASVAHRAFRNELDPKRKSSPMDVVTKADHAAQEAAIDRIRRSTPSAPIIAEEATEPQTIPETGLAWVIDPIDGTYNFARGIPLFGTAVAALEDGQAVAGAVVLPAIGDRFIAGTDRTERNGNPVTVSEESDPDQSLVAPASWWRFEQSEQYAFAFRQMIDKYGDFRRFGCAQATLAHVATGAIDGVLTFHRPHPWDSIAGVQLIRQAGGRVTDLDGAPWRHQSEGLIASNGRIHDALLDTAAAVMRDGSVD